MSVELQQGEWKLVPSDEDEVRTGGLGPCLGVLIYDPDTQSAYGGHFVSPCLHEKECFEAFLEAAFAACRESGGLLRVYVAGCNDGGEEAELPPVEARQCIEKTIERYAALATADLHFLWREGDVTEIALDLKTGELHIEKGI